jgi:enoyl-CoA hydratase/carnithine racemase
VSDEITLSVTQGVATLCLNREEKRNAVTFAMWVAIGEHCRRLAGDPTVRVLVVRGAGAHFCAGADIAGLQSADHSYGAANLEAETALMEFPKPTIAFVQGVCVGGGVQIATSCDLRIADRTARFGITPARLGIIYPAPALARVVKLTGPSAAKHLLYSAELITAERALRIGLIDELHEPDEAVTRLQAFVTLLAEERSPLTQQASKSMIDAVVADGRVGDECIDRWAAEMAVADDPKEGVAAFLERRPPHFSWAPRRDS